MCCGDWGTDFKNWNILFRFCLVFLTSLLWVNIFNSYICGLAQSWHGFGCGLNNWGTRVWFLRVSRYFFFSKTWDRLWPYTNFCLMDTGAVSTGTEVQWHTAHSLLLSIIEIKNEWNSASTFRNFFTICTGRLLHLCLSMALYSLYIYVCLKEVV